MKNYKENYDYYNVEKVDSIKQLLESAADDAGDGCAADQGASAHAAGDSFRIHLLAGHVHVAGDDECFLPGHALPVERGCTDLDVPDAYFLPGEHHSREVDRPLSHEPHVSVHLLHALHHLGRHCAESDHLSVLHAGLCDSAFDWRVGVPEKSGSLRFLSVMVGGCNG